jgi:2-keto-4-pentenoate hydratase/2-oxohepta-3-ene-1,7-dioic acid hydratase in catechol pathway
MKYARVKYEGKKRYGVLREGKINFLSDSPVLMNDVTETGETASVKDVEFLPVVNPPNIIALGLNYREHARESNMELPCAPVVFLKATTAVTGHLHPIILPAEAPDYVDYEAEFTIIIGEKAKNVSISEAPRYIFGYTCGNDVSARDCQMKLDRQWARAKSFDTFAPIGPVLETEIDPTNLNIKSKVNGKVMQNSSTTDMIFNPAQIVSYLSRQMTLLPETVIMTGTPSGVGFARNPRVLLRQGDIVEVEIEGIGVLRNYVEKE